MQCEFFFVCDYAQQSGGKLHAIGIGWNVILAPMLPVTQCISFAANIRGSIAEVGTKDVALRLIDADGVDVMPPFQVQIAFDVKPPLREGRIELALQLNGVEFKKYGSYAAHLLIQGYEIGNWPFDVTEMPKI